MLFLSEDTAARLKAALKGRVCCNELEEFFSMAGRKICVCFKVSVLYHFSKQLCSLGLLQGTLLVSGWAVCEHTWKLSFEHLVKVETLCSNVWGSPELRAPLSLTEIFVCHQRCCWEPLELLSAVPGQSSPGSHTRMLSTSLGEMNPAEVLTLIYLILHSLAHFQSYQLRWLSHTLTTVDDPEMNNNTKSSGSWEQLTWHCERMNTEDRAQSSCSHSNSSSRSFTPD